MLRNILKKYLKIENYCKYSYNVNNITNLRKKIEEGPTLKEFLIAGKNLPSPKFKNNEILSQESPYLMNIDLNGNQRKVHFEIYGCQMNTSDTEIIWGILSKHNYSKVDDINQADIVLLITCAVREGAETKIFNRLNHLSALKLKQKKRNNFQIGVLGCMAERLKVQLLEKEKLVDVVAGPDSYRDLPRLLAITKNTQQSAVNVLLSHDETYADVIPVRLNEDSVTAFVSIMRGCDNMCSYCIVPFTRGKEKSRKIDDIIKEVKELEKQEIKEITLLGQNVNSYRDILQSRDFRKPVELAKGFKTVYKTKEAGIGFSELLEKLANSVPEMRIRFTSPHPKDFPDDVLNVIKKYPNICKNIHLPAQSGNTQVLERMRRGYTREAYLDLVKNIRSHIPDITLSSDFICGFCGETDEEFSDTISLIEQVKYNVAYLFKYSMREKTTAHRRFKDDVLESVKNQRLQEMVQTFRRTATEAQAKFLGKTELILIEGISKRSKNEFYGRNDANIKVIIPNKLTNGTPIKIGNFVAVNIFDSNSQVLKGIPLEITSIKDFYKLLN